jgi:ribonucleotide monophosphatase NagD (HAD superfamily)
MGSAGLKTILVLSGETSLADLPTSLFKPDFIVENLADLLDKVKGNY